jgi:hypothetical protein
LAAHDPMGTDGCYFPAASAACVATVCVPARTACRAFALAACSASLAQVQVALRQRIDRCYANHCTWAERGVCILAARSWAAAEKALIYQLYGTELALCVAEYLVCYFGCDASARWWVPCRCPPGSVTEFHNTWWEDEDNGCN